MTEPLVSIDYIGGHAPLQAWGTVNGYRFYFRARHDKWTFSVALVGSVDPVDVEDPSQGFFLEQSDYGDSWAEKASWMPRADAEALIERCAQKFVEQHC